MCGEELSQQDRLPRSNHLCILNCLPFEYTLHQGLIFLVPMRTPCFSLNEGLFMVFPPVITKAICAVAEHTEKPRKQKFSHPHPKGQPRLTHGTDVLRGYSLLPPQRPGIPWESQDGILGWESRGKVFALPSCASWGRTFLSQDGSEDHLKGHLP